MICLPRSLIVDAPSRDSSHSDECQRRQHSLDASLSRMTTGTVPTTLGMLLEQSGHEVHLAHTGAEALEVAKRTRPDIGVFDIGMPDLSGYEVAERIRHEAWGKT